MKKLVLSLLMFALCGTGFSGQVGLPVEQVEFPEVRGNYLVCVWDEAGDQWFQGFVNYDHSGSYSFQLPEWGKWYWVGLWNESTGEYVYDKWVGHFPTE